MAKKSEKTPPSKPDERNLIETGATDIHEFEALLSLWWDKYKKHIIIAVAAVIGAFVIYYAVQFASRQARLSQQQAYLEAEGTEAKRSWAESHSEAPLAGYAFKELADKAYEEGNYSEAAELYRKAAAGAKSVVRDAALMGQAMSLLRSDGSGDAQAETLLLELANDPAAGNQAEALYQLAALAAKRENYQRAREHIETLQELDLNQANYFWVQKALALEVTFPPAPAEESEAEAGS